MKRITVTKLTCTLFLLLLLVACTEAEVMGGNHSGQQTGEVETTFNLEVTPSQSPVTRSITFTAQGSTTADTLQTRSATDLPDAQEKKVAGLWIGQYNADGTTLLSHQYIESVTGTEVTAKLVATTGNCNVRFVANAGDLERIETEELLNATTLSYASTKDGRPSSNLFAMTGAWTGSISGESPQQIISPVKLTRLAAKITFTYKINGTGFSFEPTSVSLKNVPDQSQVGELTTQLSSGLTYGTYAGTTSTTGAIMYWYLPENMAGTGTPAVNSEKEKTGQGVGIANATHIELLGNAVQNGVEYKNVAFRFYPGKNANDYNIKRNDHFIMSIDLKGLDISDKRITVGAIPPITVSPDGNLPAAKGGTQEVQITSRAGVVWSLPLPPWLSATVDGQTTPPGSTLTNQGACKVIFTTTEINQQTEVRSKEFTVELEKGKTESFTLTQSPLVFNVTSPPFMQKAGGYVTGSVTISEGVQWTVIPPVNNQISVNPASGNGGFTEITFTAPENAGLARMETFSVSVTGANPERTDQLKVTQLGANTITIDHTVAKAYKSQGYDLTQYPPFNYDGDESSGTPGKDLHGNSSASKIEAPYSIEVSQEQSESYFVYETGAAKAECTKLKGSGWRIPTMIELFAIYQKRNMLEKINGFASFIDSYYWSGSIYNANMGRRCRINFADGSFDGDYTTPHGFVRCVREIPY